MIKSPVNVRVRLELVARGEESVTNLTTMGLAAVVKAHLDIKRYSNIFFNLVVLILTNSKEGDAVPHLPQNSSL